ncbi:PepSY1/2 domain-containing protein [Bacillus sp. SL00103]
MSTEAETRGYNHLKGKKISKKEAIRIAQQFAPDHNQHFKVRKSEAKTNRDVYSLSMSDPDSKANFYLDLTEKRRTPSLPFKKS